MLALEWALSIDCRWKTRMWQDLNWTWTQTRTWTRTWTWTWIKESSITYTVKKQVFCYIPLGVSQLVSYYTPPHSMTVFIVLTVRVICLCNHCYFRYYSWNEEECNMILPVTHLNRTPIFLQIHVGNVNFPIINWGLSMEYCCSYGLPSSLYLLTQYKNPHGMRRSVIWCYLWHTYRCVTEHL